MVVGCCICAHLPLLGRASCAHAVLVGPHAHMHSWWELGGLNVDVMHTCICGRRGGQAILGCSSMLLFQMMEDGCLYGRCRVG